jgi:hypothetical protein
MGTLPTTERALFTRYFAVDKRTKIRDRKALGEELNLTPTP